MVRATSGVHISEASSSTITLEEVVESSSVPDRARLPLWVGGTGSGQWHPIRFSALDFAGDGRGSGLGGAIRGFVRWRV